MRYTLLRLISSSIILYLEILAKKEKVLQDMIDKLIEIGRCYGMEMNVEKTKVMKI
jgi:hypothetical protein